MKRALTDYNDMENSVDARCCGKGVPMADKTDVEVIIGGRVITLSGYESAEYIQKIATYLNGRIVELQKDPGYMKLSSDYRNILLEINVADDLFKAKEEILSLQQDAATREKDIYDLKHEMVATQMKLETLERQLKSARAENDESAKKIIRLETELKTLENK